MPKISVIIPVFGVEKFIERCARSLFEQTLDDIEYIFIDDCTPDKSIEILYNVIEKYPNRKSQVVIHKMPTNSGQAKVREWGITNATGDYVIHCDSDDWVDCTFYEKLLEKAIEENADIVYCDYYISDGYNNIYTRDVQPRLMHGPLWNKLVKSSLYSKLEEFPKDNKAEDGAIMVQLSFFAKRILHMDTALYYYYSNPDSICGDKSEQKCIAKLRQEINNTDLRIRFLTRHNCLRKYRNDIIKWKYFSRNNILPLIRDTKYYKLWASTYPEINYQIFICKSFTIKQKLYFAQLLLRIVQR